MKNIDKFFSDKPIDPAHVISLLSLIVLGVILFVGPLNLWGTSIAVLFLGVAVMTAVHHAEVIAHKVGPSLGALVLALCVTVIEVGLIVAMMTNDTPDSAVVARDTIFATIIIVTNGILGFCLLLGGLKHKELGFNEGGTSSLLTVLAILSGLTLVMPNFTTSTDAGTYSTAQLLFAAAGSLVLYLTLVLSQTQTHKDYFEPVMASDKEVVALNQNLHTPTKQEAWLSFVCLIISLSVVIGLAKVLSPAIESGVSALGAPKAVVGIVIALLVLLPETWAAISAARINQLQTSLNLALGSGAASIALTVPVVSVFSILTDRELILGVDSKGMAFLVITFVVSSFSLSRGKTTALQGVVHISLLMSFLVYSFLP